MAWRGFVAIVLFCATIGNLYAGSDRVGRGDAEKASRSILSRSKGQEKQQANGLAATLFDFKSTDQQVRERAYDQIKTNQDALALPSVRKALIDLLDREERLDRKPGDEPGEGYIEYLGELTETVARTANWHDSHEVCILALNAYFPSDFATELAVKGGKLAVPCLLNANRDYPQARPATIPVLLQINHVGADLTPSEHQMIVQAAVNGLHDSDPGLRVSIALAAKTTGTAELIPILREIELSDSYSDAPGTNHFPIREAAATAIQSIRERTETR